MRGLGAFYDTWPAPLNNPIVLLAIVAAVVLIFGGGMKFLTGKKGGGSARRRSLRLIQAKAELDRAKLAA